MSRRPLSVLVIGAHGFIGRHLVAVLSKNARISALVHSHVRGDFSRAATSCVADLTRGWPSQGLPLHIDTVVYLAQSPYFREFPRRAREIYQVNAGAVLSALEYARRAGAQRFILASTGGIDADFSGLPGYLRFYFSTKIAAEQFANQYASCMKIIIARFFFVYGPGQQRTMLIPRLIDYVRKGRQMHLKHSSEGIKINPVYVHDAAAALARACFLDTSCTVDIAGPKVYSMRSIGTIIGNALGKTPRFSVHAGSTSKDIVGDIRRMKRLLVAPIISLEEGVRSLL